MENTIIKGRVWKFGDNISTDLIMPSFGSLSSPDMPIEQAATFCMQTNRPGWSSLVKAGDIIIAGKNFGCGSSRPGAKLLKALGIRLIIAESTSRIFFRNSINLGLPILNCPGICQIVEEGDTLHVDMEIGQIRSLATEKIIKGDALPYDSPPAQILRAGGLIPLLEQELKESSS